VQYDPSSTRRSRRSGADPEKVDTFLRVVADLLAHGLEIVLRPALRDNDTATDLFTSTTSRDPRNGEAG
jgi:hypothetical protein